MSQPTAKMMASTNSDVPGRKKQMMPAMAVSTPSTPKPRAHHPGRAFSRTAAMMRITPAAMS